MNEIFKSYLSLSLSGSLLILILLICRSFLQKRTSRQWQYYLWLIVAARLLLPIAPEANLMNHVFRTAGTVFSDAAAHVLPAPAAADGATAVQADEDRSAPAPSAADRPAAGQSAAGLSKIGAARDLISLLQNQFWLFWLLPALLLFLRKIALYQRFVNYVKSGQLPVSDPKLLDRAATAARETGVRKTVELCVNPVISSPMLLGFFRPCIVLPCADLPEEEFWFTVLHELTHFKRRDMFYKWLIQITLCLHWFNPLVYLMEREIRKACEFSCDEALISRLDAAGRQAYGKTLLDAMSVTGKCRQSLASVTLSENKITLKERLTAIMKYQKFSKRTLLLMLTLTFLFASGATAAGAYAAPVTASISASAPLSGHKPAAVSGNSTAAAFPEETPGLSPRQQSLAAELEPFRSLGLVYDHSLDTVFYDGQPVKAFVDFQDETLLSFQVGYFDNSLGTDELWLITRKDENGKVTGIVEMSAAVREMLEEAEGKTEDSVPAASRGKDYICFNGNTVIQKTIFATDTGTYPPEIADRLTGSRESGKAYLLKADGDEQQDAWVYCDNGTKMAWKLETDGTALKLYLFTDAPEEQEGATVIHYQAPAIYQDPEIYLDGEKLTVYRK